MGTLLVIAFITLVAFALGVAGAGWGASARPLSSVPAPSGTVQFDLIWIGAPGLERSDSGAEKLDRYGWVDRDAGTAHVPIDRAIELTLKERK